MKYLIAVFGIPACLGLGWYIYENSLQYKQTGRRQRSEEPVSVNVVSLQHRTLEETVRLVGRLEPRGVVTLRAQVPGYITTISGDVGDRVAAGKPVVLLDDTKHKQAVASADAALEVARANLQVAKKERDPARLNLKRYRDLLKQGTATTQQVLTGLDV